MRILPSPLNSQRGAALITGLIFVVMLTIIGVTATRMASLEERMAGNMRDRSLAMQAAELTLRDAERDITNAATGSARGITGITAFSTDCGASTTATTQDDGLCYNGSGGFASPIWTTASMTGAPSVVIGAFTGAAALPFVSAQPRYLIEGFRKQVPGSGSDTFFYRITTRAQGANPNTVVWLQEVIKP
ncbi:MAG: PilX N-terminal domain-containing pilus assembly protein [Pseudomonadota bacterium]